MSRFGTNRAFGEATVKMVRPSVVMAWGLVWSSPGVAGAVENGFGARVGLEPAVISYPALFSARASAPGRAVSFDLERYRTSFEFGGRIEAGWNFVGRKVALFPHLVAAYTPMRESEFTVETSSTTYTFRTHPSWWSIGVGPEIQLCRRILLLSPEVGIAELDPRARFASGDLSGKVDGKLTRLWLRMAVGGRFPSGSALTGGAQLGVEMLAPKDLFGQAAYRAGLTLFLELDGSQ